jgi:hypothetical protein
MSMSGNESFDSLTLWHHQTSWFPTPCNPPMFYILNFFITWHLTHPTSLSTPSFPMTANWSIHPAISALWLCSLPWVCSNDQATNSPALMGVTIFLALPSCFLLLLQISPFPV